MRILRIVSVIRLIAVPVVILSNKIYATDVAICLIELVVDNDCNNFILS